MAQSPTIILNKISATHLPPCFSEVNLCLSQSHYGIVGRNGIGKTTLLKLILGELIPISGSIQRLGSVSYVPQLHTTFKDTATIAEVLGIDMILAALLRVNNGSCSEADFDIIGHHWDIEARVSTALSQFNLAEMDLHTSFKQLSGGQKTKVLLAKTLIFTTDFILFDEPTNNLDKESREILYNYISSSSKGLVIVSHDRKLLNHCHTIIELTAKEVATYGGNYDFYKEQQAIKKQALLHDIQAQTELLKKSKQLAQTRLERHQQNEARGKKGKLAQIKAKGSYDKIAFNSAKGRSEKTNRRIRLQAERKIESVNTELTDAKAKLISEKELSIALDKTAVANNKIMINIEKLYFNYQHQPSLITDFTLKMVGPERLAIIGKNGSGKSTLIKLILNELAPVSGSITLGTEHITYLDQAVSFLNPKLSIVDNFIELNPTSTPFDAYSALASFKFRNKDAEQIVGDLSGGERMRAGLAVSLMSITPPQLIILDEPTNHLDFDTIEAIEQALKLYQGAILAVSHDEIFLTNIGVTRYVTI